MQDNTIDKQHYSITTLNIRNFWAAVQTLLETDNAAYRSTQN